MSIDARPEQENGDFVDCWHCGNALAEGQIIVTDEDFYAYHENCMKEKLQSEHEEGNHAGDYYNDNCIYCQLTRKVV